MKHKLSRQIFEQSSNTKISRKSVQWLLSCSIRAGRLTKKLIVVFRNAANAHETTVTGLMAYQGMKTRHTYNNASHHIHSWGVATRDTETDMSNSGTNTGVTPVCLEVTSSASSLHSARKQYDVVLKIPQGADAKGSIHSAKQTVFYS